MTATNTAIESGADSAGVGRAAPRRVAHVLWYGEIGGTERSIYQLMREQMRDPELAPAVVFAQDSGPYVDMVKELGCPVVVLGLGSSHSPRALGRAARALQRFDVHHFHSAEPLLMTASMFCTNTSRYYTHRGGLTDYPTKQRFRYWVTGRLVRGFDGLSANTAHGADCAAQLLVVDRDRFAVTYNGVDFSLLEPQTEREEVRRLVGVPEGSFVVGTLAHLRAWKRVDRLIDAVAAVADPSVRLLVVGDGPDLPRLKARAARAGLDGRAIFAGEQKHAADYLQLMDAFCLPSTGMESFGNAAVEAMATGVPSIVFGDGGGLLEHIVPGETGFVVGDDAELVRVVHRLIDEPDLRRRVGAAGREAVRTRYTLAQAARSYRDLYGMNSAA